MKSEKVIYGGREFKLTLLCEESSELTKGETPEKIVSFLNTALKDSLMYRPDRENFIVILLDTNRNILGFEIVATGILNAVLVHARETFLPAIVGGAHSIVIAHNHPSGNPTPSGPDLRMTNDLVRAGQILKIEVLDHIVLGKISIEHPKGYASLRELGLINP